MKIDEHLLDMLADEEVHALLEGMQDETLRHDPKFLASVRKFLKDNNLLVSPKTDGVNELQKEVEHQSIPIFDDMREGVSID